MRAMCVCVHACVRACVKIVYHFTGDECEHDEIGQRNHNNVMSGYGCAFLKDDDDYTVPSRDEFTLHTQLQEKHLTRESVE